MLGVESGSDVNHLTKKWREDGSEGEEEEENDEETEHDAEFKDENKNDKALKQMNENKTTIIKQNKDKSHSDVVHVGSSSEDIEETVIHKNSYNGIEDGDDTSDVNDNDDDDDVVDRNKSHSDDYRKDSGTFEESDDDSIDDVKTRHLKGTVQLATADP